MRTSSKLLLIFTLLLCSRSLFAQSCTGLCLQQVSCPGGGTTSISGVVYAPNGIDPLPHVQVYIPNAPVAPFTPGVSCPIPNATPSGSPLVGTITEVDGTFRLDNVPVGQNIPLVIVTGRWRRQLTIPTTTACTNTKLPDQFALMPQNRTQGDIPKIAIATGAEDVIECAFTDIGIDPSEITDASGGGRINLFGGSGATGSGAVVDTATPPQSTLMGGDGSTLNQYDVLMLASEGVYNAKSAGELQNLLNYANAGGRVFASHYSYSWLWDNGPFSGTAEWIGPPGTSAVPASSTGTVDTNFPEGETLSDWLQLVGASNGPGEISITNAFQDTRGGHGIIPPTQEWLYSTWGVPFTNPAVIKTATAQLVFDTPIAPSGSGVNQCGRVLYDDFLVVAPPQPVSGATVYPNECPDTANSPVSPQQKLLEFNLFELSDTGGLPTIFPSSHDFGIDAFGYPATPQAFTWTNNSTIPMTVSSVTLAGTGFSILPGGDTCSQAAVAPGASCTVTVGYTPTVIGSQSGTLTIFSGVFSEAAIVYGTGTSTFTLAPYSLSFGGIGVGTSASQTATLTSNANVPLPLPALTTTAGYTVSTAGCATPVPPQGVCTLAVTFSPTEITSPESGTLEAATLPSPERVLLYGYGVPDFLLTPATLDFGSQAIGSATTQTLTLTSYAAQPLATPVFTITGNYYTVSTAACGTTIKAGASCPVAVTFTPQTAGVFTGILTDTSSNVAYSGLNASFTGIAGDFTASFNPDSGSVIAGDPAALNFTVTELAGRDPGIALTCALPAAATGTSCSFTPLAGSATSLNATVYVATTSEYQVIGYTGLGGCRGLWLIGLSTGCLVWLARRKNRTLVRGSLLVALAAMALSLTGCSGLLPAKNASYTPPGTYAITVTATDGLLVHSATYNLTVNAK